MAVTAPRSAGAVAPPPLIFLAGFIIGIAINFLFPAPIGTTIWLQLVAVLLLFLGALLFATAVLTLSRHKTPPGPWEPTVELVRDGPYHFTRNPIYLSFALIYLGSTCIFNSLAALVILIPLLILVDRKQILREEVYLEQKFGEEYRNYKAKVRRWI